MSYANRPMGDYKTYGYAGDPGWLSSIWRGVKKIAPTIIGGLIGGPIGAVVGAAGTGGGPAPGRQLTVPGTVGGAISFPGGVSIAGGFQPGTRVMQPGVGRLPPFTATGPGVLPGGGRGQIMPSGYHYAKDGSGRIVRNRRMNVANPRALRRSMRRVQGFEKLAKRTIQFTRRVKMKKRRSA